MMTRGQAIYLSQHVNSAVGLCFIGSFSLIMGLLIWHAAFGENPVAEALSQTVYARDTNSSMLNL